MKSSIETEKIIKKAPKPMVICLTLFAIAGKVDNDRTVPPIVDEKPAITSFQLT